MYKIFILKRFIILAFLLISIINLSSCKKEEDICYTCTLKDSTRGESTGDNSGGGYNSDLESNIRFCDTEDKVKNKKTTYVNLGYTCTKE